MLPIVEKDDRLSREIIGQLEQTIGELRAENAELRARIAELEAQVGSSEPPADPPVPAFVKPDRPRRAAGQPRKKRAQGYGRKRATATQRLQHALERCGRCGCTMRGGFVKRTRQVLHIPMVPVQVIEHAFIERCCPRCGQRQVPKAREVLKEVLGRHRLSVSTMALISALREVGRLPVETVQWYLQTFHALRLSVGEIVEVLRVTAQQAQGSVGKLLQELQASPVVHGDETTWREDGQNGYMWAFSTPVLRYFLYRASRSGEIVNEVLGEAFEGTLVTDFYAGYNRMLGRHQRCWAHLLRDIHTLKEQWPVETQLHLWAEQVHALFQRACAYAQSHEQAKPKERRLAQQQFEQELLTLCQPYLASDRPQRVLCQRIARFLAELLTFVADPRVPPDNNAAERSVRPLAVSRKISGGTRSEQGTQTKSVLATLFGTWIVRGLNPFHACLALLIPP